MKKLISLLLLLPLLSCAQGQGVSMRATNGVAWNGKGSGMRPVYDVVAFGADPTGVAQSQTAIQAAIDAACVDPSKPVYIPAGTYVMKNTEPKRGFSSETALSCLVVWSNNVVIIGDGPSLTKLKVGVTTLSYQRNFFGVPDRRTLDIASATSSGTTVTMNTTTAHGLVPGDFVGVANLSPAGYNSGGGVYWTVAAILDSDTFTYTSVSSGMADATVTTASLIHDWTPDQYLIHTNLTLKGLCFDMEGVTYPSMYDTTQIYNVVGRGVIIDDCWFLNNPNNDGIDVQGYDGVWGVGVGNLTVRNCYISGNGGDAIGIQCNKVTITDTLLENGCQEALELNDAEDILVNVTARDYDRISTLNSYKFVAIGCTFTGTNSTKDSFQVGQYGTGRHISFNNCVLEETRASILPSFKLDYGNDSLSITDCDIRRQGGGASKPLLYAANASQVTLSGNTFGRSSWAGYCEGAAVTINNVNDVLIAGNLIYDNTNPFNISNNVKRLRMVDNSFRSTVAISGMTNAIIANNQFFDGATLAITNMAYSVFNGNSSITPITLGDGFTNNMFTGNTWLAAPTLAYWNSNTITGDSVTNRLFSGTWVEQAGRTKRHQMLNNLSIVQNGTYGDAVNGQGLTIESPGTGYSSIGFDGLMRFGVQGNLLWSLDSSGNLSPYNVGTVSADAIKLGNGTASVPSINFSFYGSGDTDSGFYRDSNEHIGMSSSGTMRALTTTTNLFVPNLRADQLVLTTNAAPANAVTVLRWFKVVANNGQTYLMPGYQ